MVPAVSLLNTQYPEKERDGLAQSHQMVSPLNVAFTGLAQLCGPKGKEMEMGAVVFSKIVIEELPAL